MERKKVKLAAGIYWIISSITALLLLTAKAGTKLTGYEHVDNCNLIYKFLGGGCGIIASGFVILKLANIIYETVWDRESQSHRVVFYSIPYMVIVAAAWITHTYLYGSAIGIGDETFIYHSAFQLFPFTFGITSQIFIICLCILPVSLSPVILKIIFESLVVGYLIERINRYYKTRLGFLLYIIFCMKPVLEQAVLLHRMQWFGVFYVFIAGKLYFDYREHKKANLNTIVFVSVCISLLSVWRREAFYLVILGIFLLITVYTINDRKKAILIFCVIECAFFLPVIFNEKVYQLSDSHICWQAYIVHMLAEDGLDRDRYSEELKIVDERLDIEIIDKLNTDLGNVCFAGTMWADAANEQYFAIRTDVTEETVKRFEHTVLKLAFEERGGVFLKSRINAFSYVAATENSYNLYVPLLVLMAMLIYSMIKKQKPLSILLVGILCHTILTAAFMPCSWFKYFYAIYLTAYVFGIIVLIDEYGKQR